MKKLMAGALLVIAFGLVAAGCGNDDSTTDTSAATETTDTGATDTVDTTDTSGEQTGSDAAIEECDISEEEFQAQGADISKETQEAIIDLCIEAADSGNIDDPQAQADLAIETCKLVVNDIAPEGADIGELEARCEDEAGAVP